ncbi:MAG: hypothetical protein J6K92_08100 [Oscillospiraceae bacterium]|nr:hypothetical protein [Oscillospiraceae bacterium]
MDMRKLRSTKRLRLDSLLLMMIFAVTAFALMWTAVSCFRRIRGAYESASECLGAARFTANHLKSAEGRISVFSNPDGSLDRLVIGRDDGYETVISVKGGSLWEALVPAGSDISSGERIFSAQRLFLSEAADNTVKISAFSSGGQSAVIYAEPSAETAFFVSEGGGGS